jgi:uncharacterized membrane protein YdfJ with MMPL/SSD domain
MNGGVVAAIIAAAASLILGAMSYSGSRSAQRITIATQRAQAEAEKRAQQEATERDQARTRVVIEQAAFERARESYERIVKDLEAQLERNQRTVERVQDQLDRVMLRLTDEQSVSIGLRDQVATMRDQVSALQRENERFRATVQEHTKVTGELVQDLRRGLDPADGKPDPPQTT